MLFQFQQRPRQQVDYGTGTLGLRGKLGAGWNFDLYGNFSRSSGSYSQNFVYADRMAAAVSPSGCDMTKLTSVTYCPAGGVNFWRAYQNGFTQQEYYWLIGRSNGTTTYDQYYLDGSVSGKLFALPAGDVEAAFGAHVRRESIDDRPGDSSDFDTVAMQYYLSGKPTKGRADTRELYGELGVPILRGVPLAQSLNLTLSGRLTSAEYGGTAGTYKAGLAWRPANWLMFRATQGTSFRQPKLYELFLQNQSALSGNAQLDPCSNYQVSAFLTATQKSRCSAMFGGANYIATGNANIISGGSTALKPETSFARTLGVVLSPPVLNAHLSVDYYYIHINGSVTQLGAVSIARECLLREPYPNNGFCQLVNRDPSTHQLLSITNNYINAGEEKYSGLDIAYAFDFRTGIGRFGSDGQFNIQLMSKAATFQGGELDSYLGYAGTPRFLGNVGLWYKPVPSTLIRLSAKLVGKMSNDDYFTGASPQVGPYRDTGQTVYFDRTNEFYANFTLSATRRMFGDLDLTLGIRNLLDSPPPRISVGGTGWQMYREGTVSTLSFYDLVGRSFYLSLTKSF
ncbi:MAG: TonB-dependent receptor [Sphingomonas sp.]|uniref:TonB-dependent receptor n=1 Tax=Sphingomonas sp. TaxID=28214 RepID=UPI001ACA358A|nr:TonB-dependent receptor [Sphingomonas sp.]MBN8809353.1 TonB-dependent receptor [Sphingomonas sp.]